MIEHIKKAVTELNRDKDVIVPLRGLLDKEIVGEDYVRGLQECGKISYIELMKIIS